MMDIQLKLGTGYEKSSMEDTQYLGQIAIESSSQQVSEAEVIKRALASPIGSPSLKDRVKADDTLCIIVSDVTRMYQRMSVYLPYIVEELEAIGVPPENITFLVSLGTHRKQTTQEHKLLLGEDLYNKYKIIDHDCDDESRLTDLGTTSRGTQVRVNSLVTEVDHVILTGAIVYHVMAGWGGGRKSVVPGVAARQTIMSNHAHSLHEVQGQGINKSCDCARYETNPINMDMLEASEMLDNTFLFNVILGGGRIIDAVAGDSTLAFQEGCRKVSELNDVSITEQSDMIIASAGGYPKDINFYQSTKVIYNAMRAVKEDGVIIVLANCNEGYGHPEVKFMMQDFDNNYDREMELRDKYTIGKYIGFLAAWYAQIYNIIYVSSIDPAEVKSGNIHVTSTLDEAIELAYTIKGTRDLKTYIMPDGGVFPVLS